MSVVSVCPNIDLSLLHKDVFLKCPDSVSMRQWISTSYSTNQATFSCPPPSLSVFIDRFVVLKLGFKITYTGTLSEPGSGLLQTGADALRAYPIASVTNNTQVTLNSQSYSFLTSEIIPYLAHFFKQTHFSGFPDFLDKYQRYIDGVQENNNPLGQYGNSIGQIMPRGAFPMVIINGATSSTIDVDIFEPLWIPILHGCEYDQGLGLSNIRTFDVNVNFNTNMNRIVSHAVVLNSGGVNPLVNLSNVQVSFTSAPYLYMKYSSPPLGYIPRPLEYSCDAVDRFVTSLGSAMAPNERVSNFVSSNMQLNAIPDKMLIFVRESNINLTYSSTDTVCKINGVNVTFSNMSGLLASAKPIDLFNMSKSNQLQDTWEEFSGEISNITSNLGASSKIGTVGSFLMLKFGKDITLSPGDWPGKIGAYNLQLTVDITNTNQVDTILSPSLYVICFTPQKCVIDTGGAVQNILGIPESAANTNEYVSYSNVMKHYGGSFSDFISKVGAFFRPIVDVLKKTKLISTVSSLIPHPAAQAVSQVSSKMGFGGKRGRRAGMIAVGDNEENEGGAVMSRSDLLERIRELK